MTDMVRVKTESGAEVTVPAGFAERRGLPLVEGKAAVSAKSGRVLGPTYPEVVEVAEAAAAKLKGAPLNKALTDAGLSTDGKLADKQERLAAHEASVAQAQAAGQVGGSDDAGGAAVVDNGTPGAPAPGGNE